MHYAVHGQTAAELIVNRANAEKEHMGLTTWENAPDGKIVKTDVSIAKNYLKGIELEDMGRLVNAVLDMAERMAKRHIPMTMEDWAKRLDLFQMADHREFLLDAVRLRQRLPRQKLRLNLKSIESFRTDCLCLTLINTCWNWKRMRRSSNIAIKFLAYQGRVYGSWVISRDEK